jgi:putative redox protein
MAVTKSKLVVPLRVKAECPSHSRSDISVRDLSFNIDEPVERGGTNTGASPTDTALAALIGCTNVIGHKCAKKLAIDIGHLSISLRCEFDRRGVTLEEEIDLPFTRIDMTVDSDGSATQSQLDAVAAEVAKYCPLSKLYRQAGTMLTEQWRLKKQLE